MTQETETLYVMFFSYLGIKHFAIPLLAEGLDRLRQRVISWSEEGPNAQDRMRYGGIGKCGACIRAGRTTFTGPLYRSVHWSGPRWPGLLCRRCFRSLKGALSIDQADRSPGTLSLPTGGDLALLSQPPAGLHPPHPERAPPPQVPMPKGGRPTLGRIPPPPKPTFLHEG